MENQNETELEQLKKELNETRKRLEWYEAAHMLLANEYAFINRKGDPIFFLPGVVGKEFKQPALAVNVNDAFWWACADAEPFGYFDAPALLEIVKRDGEAGLVKWVRDQRMKRPQGFDYDEHHVARFTPELPALDRAEKAEQERDKARAEVAKLREQVETQLHFMEQRDKMADRAEDAEDDPQN